MLGHRLDDLDRGRQARLSPHPLAERSRVPRSFRILKRLLDGGCQSILGKGTARDRTQTSPRPMEPLSPEELVPKEWYDDRRFSGPGSLGGRPGASVVNDRVHSAKEPVERHFWDRHPVRRSR